MLEKALKVLNDILVDFEKRYNYYQSINSNTNLDELKSEINIILQVTFSENTRLFLFEQLITEFLKDKSPALFNYYVHESRNLLRVYPFKNFIYGSWYRVLENTEDRDLNSAEGYYADYSPLISKISDFQNKANGLTSYTALKEVYLEILQWYANDIDMLAYYSFNIRNPKVDDHDNFVPYDGSSEYVEEWYNGRVTLNIWRKYPNTIFLNMIENLFPKHYLEVVNNHQLELYNEALDLEFNGLKSNIINSPIEVQKINITRQLNLINKFTLGDFSELDFQRLSQIIVFDRPNEVILAYDDIMRFDNYDFTKILPYDGKDLRKSPRFVADLLIKYEQFLIKQSDLLERTDNKELQKIVKKPKPKNFGFNKRKKLQVLKDVLLELNLKYELIENDFDDLINVLTNNDYTTLPFEIKLNCNTNIFSYVLKGIDSYFSNLNSASIQNSGRFLTKKEGKPLTSTNFNKSANSLKDYKKEEIDKILIKLKE
jgi:hypothetical protein